MMVVIQGLAETLQGLHVATENDVRGNEADFGRLKNSPYHDAFLYLRDLCTRGLAEESSGSDSELSDSEDEDKDESASEALLHVLLQNLIARSSSVDVPERLRTHTLLRRYLTFISQLPNTSQLLHGQFIVRIRTSRCTQ